MFGLSRAFCIPKSPPGDAAQAAPASPAALMDEWLAARGFEPAGSLPQWPCDDALERGLFLFEDDRWTILLYSGADGALVEDNRLILHLARAGGPLLYAWTCGHAWGYRIHEGREVLDAYHAGADLAPDWLTEYPGHGDLEFLCETFKSTARPRLLREIRQSRVIAREHVAARFFDELGVAPAAFGYDRVEWRFLTRPAAGAFGGFAVTRDYFVKRGFRPGEVPALALHQIPPRRADAAAARTGFGWPMPSDMFDEGYFVAIARLFALIHALLMPVMIALGVIGRTAVIADRFYRLMGWDQRSAHRGRFARELFAESDETFTVSPDRGRKVSRVLRNSLRQCEVVIPKRARPLDRNGPGVFAFAIGKVHVHCDAIRTDADDHVRRMFRYPATFAVVTDESFTTAAGQFPARVVAWRLEHERHAMWVTHWIVQTPAAYFEFAYRTHSKAKDADRSGAEHESLRPLMRDVVDSFRIVPPATLTADTSATAAAAPTT